MTEEVKVPYWDPLESADPANRDQVTGHLLPGHKLRGPGGGQRLSFITVVKRKAKAAGMSLDNIIWLTTKGLARRAALGDAAAAKILLDRLCGPVEKGIEVHVDARTAIANQGPPVPRVGEFKDWVLEVNKIAAQQGMLGDTTPAQLVVDAEAAVAAEDELLG